jgi:hypothetical protein
VFASLSISSHQSTLNYKTVSSLSYFLFDFFFSLRLSHSDAGHSFAASSALLDLFVKLHSPLRPRHPLSSLIKAQLLSTASYTALTPSTRTIQQIKISLHHLQYLQSLTPSHLRPNLSPSLNPELLHLNPNQNRSQSQRNHPQLSICQPHSSAL